MWRLASHVILISAAAHLLSGCVVLGYYKQSFSGHIDLMRRAQPIERVIAAPAIDASLRSHLQQLLEIRRYAIEELHLPDNGSYLQYVDLGRDFVVWNVFATPEFSLESRQSCFPVVGCLSYRGYFSEADARKAAQQLASEGNDVYVGGVAAYSTLGWFADPVLSSMLRWDDSRLAQLIFHELAHQRVYVEDDSDFNEAFATAVGEIGVQRWLRANGRQEEIAGWQVYRQRQKDFLLLVKKTAERLHKLYAIQADSEAMRTAKAEVFEDMRGEYRQLRDGQWGSYDGYDHWFATANNARVAAVATYHDLVPGFMAIYRQGDEDIQSFYATGAELARRPFEERRASLGAAVH